ncbi:hypothetical protein EYF80_046165 [Liparis tanakae]|uniref:Uncharacterized protein n=1 Tax=Liparis tanakae TaxID=230148 RepID=A0A4Z2FRL1_9TELE|nr:hypothetical protein EYF80_046165 [Liparis tanakae]
MEAEEVEAVEAEAVEALEEAVEAGEAGEALEEAVEAGEALYTWNLLECWEENPQEATVKRDILNKRSPVEDSSS